MKNRFNSVVTILTFALFACTIQVHSQIRPDLLDSNIKYGVLENGLTYYLLHNEEPKDRASFYMVQNVGSILENDHQKGLAHFLEHMAFNGTTNFPKKGMLNYLESKGARFGRDINAYTSFDETVYNISNMPSNNAKVLDSCLLALHDWSNSLTLSDVEIDSERGVINEEWRTRRNARKRISDKQTSILFADSKYAKRDIIGSMKIVQNFKYEALRDFYHKWYRTDLQAIVIVGDFNVNKVEQKIKKLFSTIPRVQNAPERKYFEVPNNSTPKYALATDKEATNSFVNIQYKYDVVAKENKDLNYLKKSYVQHIYTSIVNNRLHERTQKENPPFIGAQLYFTSLYLTKNAAGIYTSFNDNKWAEALKEAYLIIENIRDFGVTKSELDRAKENILSSITNQYTKRAKRNNDSYAGEIARHYLENEPVPGITFELDLVKKYVPKISLQEVNTFSSYFFKPDNMLISVSGPEKAEITYPSKKEILNIIKQVKNTKMTPYVDAFKKRALISNLPAKGKITSSKHILELDAKMLTLSNGIKVYTKHSTLEKGIISLTGYSAGGASLLPMKDVPNAALFNQFINSYGVGDFNATDLNKALNGKIASVSPNLGEYNEGIYGSASPKDLETMFQLTHLYFTKPRFDKEAYNALSARFKVMAKQFSNNIGKAYQDTIKMVSANYHPRVKIIDDKLVDQISFERIKAIYRERFLNPTDFFFVLTGDFDAEKLHLYLEKYLGSLPKNGVNESFKDNMVRPPSHDVSKYFEKALATKKASVHVSFSANMSFSEKNNIYLGAISSLLSKRYMEEIREKEGGTYGVRVSRFTTKTPYENANLSLSFDCEPENASKLKAIALAEIEKLKKGHVNKIDLAEIKNNLLKERSEYIRKLRYWQRQLVTYGLHKELNMNDVEFNTFVAGITKNDILKTANAFFTDAVKIEVTMSSKK